VWDTRDRLILSKGHEITLPLLERMRNYSRGGGIREPIRVWVSLRHDPSRTSQDGLSPPMMMATVGRENRSR
jgi:hypothetical protein